MPDDRGSKPVYMTESDVRRILRQEIPRYMRAILNGQAVEDADASDDEDVVIEDDMGAGGTDVTGGITGSDLLTGGLRRRGKLNIDKVVDALEAESLAPALTDYALRKEAGMSDAAAEVLTKLDKGIDPTPLEFGMPSPQSYFLTHFRPSPGADLIPRQDADGKFFKDYFVDLINAGATTHDAYKETCKHFALPDLEKPDPRKKIHGELPAQAGGAFRLGRGDAEAGVGSKRLGPKKEDE